MPLDSSDFDLLKKVYYAAANGKDATDAVRRVLEDLVENQKEMLAVQKELVRELRALRADLAPPPLDKPKPRLSPRKTEEQRP